MHLHRVGRIPSGGLRSSTVASASSITACMSVTTSRTILERSTLGERVARATDTREKAQQILDQRSHARPRQLPMRVNVVASLCPTGRSASVLSSRSANVLQLAKRLLEIMRRDPPRNWSSSALERTSSVAWPSSARVGQAEPLVGPCQLLRHRSAPRVQQPQARRTGGERKPRARTQPRHPTCPFPLTVAKQPVPFGAVGDPRATVTTSRDSPRTSDRRRRTPGSSPLASAARQLGLVEALARLPRAGPCSAITGAAARRAR